MRVQQNTAAAIILAIGVALGGLLIGWGFSRGRAADRYVTVKGVAERDVTADLAIWPLRIVAADNDLTTAHNKLQSSVQKVMQFIAASGIDTASASLVNFEVSDAYTNQYGGADRAASRYVIHQTVVVRSNDPAKVLAASQRVAELVNSGVVLSSGGQYGSGGPTFVFTGLNKLKPTMIGEATARAREGAEQFARDSKSEIGGIKTANQGVFQILARDQAMGITEESQIEKTVRVVSTIDYYLKD
jgi:hypothetical protein